MPAAELHFEFRITPQESGRRLDQFLASRIGSLSRMRIAALLDEGACLVNQSAGVAGYHLSAGDVVEMAFDGSIPTAMSPEPIPLEIVHEDAHLLVVVKPAGILVHPTRGVKTGTLLNALAFHLNRFNLEVGGLGLDSNTEFSDLPDARPVIRPGLVHRLDRATSGLMVIAKSQRALTILSRHFNRRLVRKRYVALLKGKVAEDSFEVVAPIGRDAGRRPRWGVMENGRDAHTRIRVLQRSAEVTLVKLEPVTGRTNQLRIHCASVGHPVVGDELYGDCGMSGREVAPLPESSNPADERAESGSRLCLHAWHLGFHHPAGGTWMEFISAIPGDWPEIAGLSWLELKPQAADDRSRPDM